MYAKPKAWKRNLWELDPINPENNGLQNEDLIVWMRTAAFPSFRKPYRKINHKDSGNIALSTQFKDGIPKGNYSLVIEYNYEVSTFSGTKQVVLTTVSILGGKNLFLGVAYTVVGCCCLVLGGFLLFSHRVYGKAIQDDNDYLKIIEEDELMRSKAHKPSVDFDRPFSVATSLPDNSVDNTFQNVAKSPRRVSFAF